MNLNNKQITYFKFEDPVLKMAMNPNLNKYGVEQGT